MSWRSTLSDSVVSSSGGTMSGLQELKKCNEDFMALKATLKEQFEEGLMDEKLYGIMVKQGEKALKREVAKIAGGGGSNAPRGQGKQVMKVEKVKKRQREDGEEDEEDDSDEEELASPEKPRRGQDAKRTCTRLVALGSDFEVLYRAVHATDPTIGLPESEAGKRGEGCGARHYGLKLKRPGGDGGGGSIKQPGTIMSRTFKDDGGNSLWLCRDKNNPTGGNLYIPPGQGWFGFNNLKPTEARADFELAESIVVCKPPADEEEASGYNEWVAQCQLRSGRAVNQPVAPRFNGPPGPPPGGAAAGSSAAAGTTSLIQHYYFTNTY